MTDLSAAEQVVSAPESRSWRDSSLVAPLAEAALVVALLCAFVVYVAPTLGHPLLEAHAFRQTQTAYTARIYHEEGIDLLHPKLPVFGEPFEVPFEFPLFQAAASLVMDVGVQDDAAMRSTGLVCFLATALLLYGLVRTVAGRVSGLVALLAFVATPLALLWSRASMIEYLATAGAVGFAWATIAWRESRKRLPGALALGAGLVGMLVKPTTAVFWVLPALVYRPGPGTKRVRGFHFWTLVLVLAPLAAAFLWTRHADAVKASSPTTAWLTSGALREWNFGTLAQRLDPRTWELIVDRLRPNVIGIAGVFLLLVVPIAIFKSPQRRFWLGMVLAASLPLFVFTNLYAVHDYYLIAVSPAVAALIGLGAGFVWGLLPHRPLVAGVVALALLVLQYSSLDLGRGYWGGIDGKGNDPGVQAVARELAAHTEPDDRVALVGFDWSPAVLYYAHRWGHMVTPRTAHVAYDVIHDDDYRYLAIANPSEEDFEPIAQWRWLGALAPHTYAIADSPDELSGSQFVVADDATTSATFLARGTTIDRDIRIPCGRPVLVRSGVRGTWIELATASPSGRISASDELAPLPMRRVIYVDRALSEDGMLQLTCTGPPALVVDMVDAEGPSSS